MRLRWLIAAALLLAPVLAQGAQGAEVKLFASGALKEAYLELIPDFEKASGHKVTVAW